MNYDFIFNYVMYSSNSSSNSSKSSYDPRVTILELRVYIPFPILLRIMSLATLLYRLKQTSQQWYDRLQTTLRQFGFFYSKSSFFTENNH